MEEKKIVVSSDFDAYNQIQHFILEKTFVNDRKMKIHDVMIATLFNSMIEKSRSIELLVQNNVLDSIEVIQRSMVEQDISLKYILEKDTVRRGRACFYGHKCKEIRDIEDTFKHHPNKNMMQSISQGIITKFEVEHKEKFPTYEDYKMYMESRYNELFQERIKNRKYWFNIDGGASSIAKLFELMNEADEYYGFYVPYSAYTHGNGVVSDTNFKRKKFEIEKMINKKRKNLLIATCLKSGIDAIARYYGVSIIKEPEISNKYRKIIINYKYNNM